MEAYIDQSGLLMCACEAFLNPKHHPLSKKGWPRHCEHTDALRKAKSLRTERAGEFYVLAANQGTGASRRCDKLMQKFEAHITALSHTKPEFRYMAMADIERIRFPLESALMLGRCDEIKQRYMEATAQFHALAMEAVANYKG